MKVEIFTITFNSMYIMPFFIEHYRERFPDAVINVYDDGSTDSTASYCRNMGCNVVDIPQPSDCLSGAERANGLRKTDEQRKINHVHKINNLRAEYWKQSKADWVIVVDQDELVEIWEKDLPAIENYDLIIFEGYNMYNETGNPEVDLRNLKFAIDKEYDQESDLYDKPLMMRSNAKLKITGGGHNIVTEEGLNLHNRPSYLKISYKDFKMFHYPKRMLSKEEFFKHYLFAISLPDHAVIEQIKNLYESFTTNIKLVQVR